MCKAMEDMRNEAVAKERRAIAVSLWNDGIQDMERIARLTKLSLEEVQKTIGTKAS